MKESVAIAKDANTKQDSSPTRSDNSIQRLRDEPERQLGSLRSVIGDIRRNGGTPSVEGIATQLGGMGSAQRAPVLSALQQTHGNRYVQRVVAGIQAKLVVGQPGDIYEQEADRVAEQVMQMPEPRMQRQPEEENEEEKKKKEKRLLQAKPLAEQITPLVQRQVEEEELQMQPIEEEEEELQAKEISGQILDLEASINAVRGSGQPLPKSALDFFEPRFGYDFSMVRVHTDARAAESARTVGARAYTIGSDVVFGASQYVPGTTEGRRLLTHELTHVVQQADRATSPPPERSVGGVGDVYEHEAEVAAHRLSNVSAPVHRVPAILQRSPQPVIMRTPIFTSTMEICRMLLESRVFHVSQGGVVVTANASWGASPEWQGTEAPRCGRAVYNMTLNKKGWILDSEYGSCEFTQGRPFSRTWANLPEGDYYLTIWTNNTNPNCCLRGDIMVSQERGLSGRTCTQPPPGPLEIMHTALDATGLIPVLGVIPDAVNAGIYSIEGNWLNAGISAAAMVPIFGMGATVTRYGLRVTGEAVERVGREGIERGIRGARASWGLVETAGERGARALTRRIAGTHGLGHSFDRHSAQWFGRPVSRGTHLAQWQALIERAAQSRQIIDWSTGGAPTVGHLARIEGKYLLVQFYKSSGELATAFVPNQRQLSEIFNLLRQQR